MKVELLEHKVTSGKFLSLFILVQCTNSKGSKKVCLKGSGETEQEIVANTVNKMLNKKGKITGINLNRDMEKGIYHVYVSANFEGSSTFKKGEGRSPVEAMIKSFLISAKPYIRSFW